ncbi:MAG: Molybdopterin-synthase adenylyltransferase [Gammaproteobacteria bacterium]|nr:Molybdopterin-synthase adenylyltransferase [Gammaproteobacteria bacterium]
MTSQPAQHVASDEQLLRYSRQIFLPEIDVEGQNRLLNSSVVIFGMGGLGSPASIYLATSGVGELVLVDPDKVELSNLQRQIVHMNSALGQPKVDSAERTLKALNPDVCIRSRDQALPDDELDEVVRQSDVVVDGTDNFEARFAINAACVRIGKPLVSAAVVRMEGQVSVYRLDRSDAPCYGCLYRNIAEPPQNCAENGVLGSVAGLLGCIQATETIKVLLNFGEPLDGRLLLIDARTMEWQSVRLQKDPKCPVCGPPD